MGSWERALKRKREKGEDDDDIINESKKQGYWCDGIHGHGGGGGGGGGGGVFDFPWLKEGLVFKVEDDEHEHQFSPCSYIDEAPPNFDQSSLLNLCVSPTLDAKFYDDDGFWSLLADVPDPVDCIWNFVIDQPLDMGFSKGV